MPPGTKYVRTIQRNWLMIKKKLSGHILFDDSVKSPQAIRRWYGTGSYITTRPLVTIGDIFGMCIAKIFLLKIFQ